MSDKEQNIKHKYKMKGGLIKELQGTQDYSPSVRRFLQQNGDQVITHIQVIRKPVMSAISSDFGWNLRQFPQAVKEETPSPFQELI